MSGAVAALNIANAENLTSVDTSFTIVVSAGWLGMATLGATLGAGQDGLLNIVFSVRFVARFGWRAPRYNVSSTHITSTCHSRSSFRDCCGTLPSITRLQSGAAFAAGYAP